MTEFFSSSQCWGRSQTFYRKLGLYKKDTEKYKVKRRKDLEGIKPFFTYKQQRKRHMDKQDSQQSLNDKEVKIAEIEDVNTQDDSTLDVTEQDSGMQMSGM